MNRIATLRLVTLLLGSVAAPALAQATPPTAAAQARSPALASILADYEAYLRALDPITAGQEGDQAAKARLPDPTRAFEVAQTEPLTAFKTRLAAIDASGLSPDDALNHAFLTRIVDRGIEAMHIADEALVIAGRAAGGEADHDGDDAGHKTEGRMENLPEKVIFPAGARKGGREFGVAKGPAQGKDAPEAPEDHDRGARGDVTDLEAETGEDTGADHIGHDQRDADRHADRAGRGHAHSLSAWACQRMTKTPSIP
jgi:hypothetical protein